jgi:uncharacterized ion transporter superfamily protein YfcC
MIHFLSITILATIYYINRVVIGFIPWMDLTPFSLWNYPLPEDVEEDWEKEEAELYKKLRVKSTMFVVILLVIYLIWLFIPTYWFWWILTILGSTLTISLVIAFIIIRRKRKKVALESKKQ